MERRGVKEETTGAEPAAATMSRCPCGAACLPPALASHLHAVPLHCPPQGVHSLPTDQDAQVDEQHAPHNHKQLLVFDDLQRERAKGGRHERAVRQEEPRSLLYLASLSVVQPAPKHMCTC